MIIRDHPIFVAGVAALDYEGLPEGFSQLRREQYAQRVAALEKALSVPVVDLGIVGNDKERLRAVERAGGQNPGAIVVLPLIAARAGLMWELVGAWDAPVMIWSVPDHDHYPQDYSAKDAMIGSGPVSAFALGNMCLRNSRPFRATERTELLPEDRGWITGASHAAAFPQMKFARIGGWFEGMDDCQMDLAALKADIGCSFKKVTLPPAPSCTNAEEASDALSKAMLDAAKDYDGVAIHCWSDAVRGHEGYGVTACLGVSRLLSTGKAAACMGDAPTVIALSVANALTGGGHYTEVDAVDRERGAMLLSNGGELDTRMVGADQSEVPNQFFSGARGFGKAWRGALKPGPASLIGFTPSANGWRLVTCDGELIDDRLIDFPVPHGFFRPHGDPHLAWSAMVAAGATHHMAVGACHVRDSAALWAQLLEIEHRHVSG